MDNTREKLIELLESVPQPENIYGQVPIGACRIADHLIANGVVISKMETPTTNADRLRAMSDEELVEILITIRCQECPAYYICDLPTGNFGKCRGTCMPQILKWLKQPADGDGHGEI